MTTPLRVGILNDMAEGPPAPDDMERWLKLVADEYVAAARLDREVEFVQMFGLGLPSGTTAAVQRAYEMLAADSVLLIVGPAIGDNALAATPLAERFHIPTINWAGAERARSEYMFHLQVGSHEDESLVLARYLSELGVRRVAIAHDKSPIGKRHLQFFADEADVLGLRIAATVPLAPLAEHADAEINELLEAPPDALVYLGLGLSAPAVARAARSRDWDGPCVMNSAGLRGYAPDFGRIIEGWVYIDMHSDHNITFRTLRQRLAVPIAKSLAAAKGYDLGRLVAEGLARASELTRDGVKDGLECVKWLHAAEGHEGTLLGFGIHDRGALHGRYLVLRQWRDGLSVEIASG